MTNSSQNHSTDDGPEDSDSEIADPSGAQQPAKSSSPTAAELREARLKAIQQAVQDGIYDSDEFLEKALRRMLESSDFQDDE